MKIKNIEWSVDDYCDGDSSLNTFHSDDGNRITVVDRLTGFGWRAIETGLLDKDGEFWLASGNFDIRMFPELEISEAIKKIKENANTCIGEKK